MKVKDQGRKCFMSVHPERIQKAAEFIKNNRFVNPESVSVKSDRIIWTLDSHSVPEGDGPSIELMIIREAEKVCKS